MKLKRPLPPNRTLEQIKNHYFVEKALADNLKKANREDRKKIYATMYDELFSKVPDHSRLTKGKDDTVTKRLNKTKYGIIKRFVNTATVFAEFGSGDCRFATKMANHVNTVYAIDISDQRNPEYNFPKNFKLIVYDGYQIEDITDNAIDIIFSDQLIEHLHPEDTKNHFELALRILKPGGKYIFKTPHALLGPRDISQYFSDEPEGFHLKEWLYGEINTLLKETGYSKIYFYWTAKGYRLRLPKLYFFTYEHFFSLFPKRYIRLITKFTVPSLMCIAVK